MFTSTQNHKEYGDIIFTIGEGNLQFQPEAWIDKKVKMSKFRTFYF